ncbi:MAG: glycosyltransferase, partial [Chryseobacterium sp.]
PEIIRNLPYYIPVKEKINNKKINKNRLTIGATGTIDWRKSPDIFISIAAAVFYKRPEINIEFRWKGAYDGLELERLRYDVNKAGLDKNVFFINSSDEMDEFYSSLDILLLTSREDPYPLVVLEAASWGIPTICFEKAGGATEFVEYSNGGVNIPYLDINSASELILSYHDFPELFKARGFNAQTYISATHQNKQYVNDYFTSSLELILRNVQD